MIGFSAQVVKSGSCERVSELEHRREPPPLRNRFCTEVEDACLGYAQVFDHEDFSREKLMIDGKLPETEVRVTINDVFEIERRKRSERKDNCYFFLYRSRLFHAVLRNYADQTKVIENF